MNTSFEPAISLIDSGSVFSYWLISAVTSNLSAILADCCCGKGSG
jgi:hypothetical protein